MIPFSFGGNKARKAVYFFNEIISGGFDTVVTYGSSSSNHCRIIANMAASKNLNCIIISPEENYTETFNSILIKQFGAKIIKAPLENISETIDSVLNELSKKCKPYFIQGGGHGNLGTQAYIDAYSEIFEFEKQHDVHFDYIFHASGTGTTQAGLVCGAALKNDFSKKIIGISIARRNPRGKQVVEQSVKDYFDSIEYTGTVPIVIFDDSYVCGGYGNFNSHIEECIRKTMIQYGIPLNKTYTGKAFWGMEDYIQKHGITNCNILFIHTGGVPLFFDDSEEFK